MDATYRLLRLNTGPASDYFWSAVHALRTKDVPPAPLVELLSRESVSVQSRDEAVEALLWAGQRFGGQPPLEVRDALGEVAVLI